jgi:hypothetical protein
MISAKLAFLAVAASAVALTAHGANAASLDRAYMALKQSGARSRLVQEAHGCHYTCESGR